MSSGKGVEQWPGLSAALAGFLPLRPDMRHLVPGAEGLIYTPSQNYSKYSYINQKSFAFAVVFTISISLTAIMWLTSAYDNAVLKLVSIRDDIDTVFENWKSPPTRSRLMVHVFNYTNADAVLKGEVPKVQEVGPYVFSEKLLRRNIKFNENGTVSFQETRTIKPLPELSNGTLNDTVFVPNVPYLTIVAVGAQSDFGFQTLLQTVFNAVKAQLLVNVTVNDFIWGMNDEFFSFLQTIKSFLGDEIKPFGFLAKRHGEGQDVITMNTGNKDSSLAGVISRWNGASRIGKWGDTPCDTLQASDGSRFPARQAFEKLPLKIYSNGMCRKIPLKFNRTTLSKDGFPVNQYHVASDMFDYTSNEENKCYSINGEYPKNGVFSNVPCQNGAPIFASFPHFMGGDPSLREDVLGLKPDEEKHTSFFQIHERLGISLLVKTRFQINVMFKKPSFMNHLSAVKDNIILPVAWLEYDSGEFEEDFVNSMYHLTYTVRIVEEILKWTLLVITLTSLVFFSLEIKKCIKK